MNNFETAFSAYWSQNLSDGWWQSVLSEGLQISKKNGSNEPCRAEVGCVSRNSGLHTHAHMHA